MEKIDGYLDGGVSGWIRNGYELDYIPQITAQDLAELLSKEPDSTAVLDVREPSETASEAIANSTRIPLGQLSARVNEIERGKLLVVHCKGGYRSSIATSLLRRAGFRDIANLTGGFDAWKAAGLSSAVLGEPATAAKE
jgi:rhodanese-related sulfurtransferase